MAETKKKQAAAPVLKNGERTVALDIGSRNVKLAVLRRRKGNVEVESLDSMPIPFASSRGDVTTESVKETVRQLLQRNRIKDVGVLSVMSRDFVTVSHVELPSVQREQIKQMLLFEAESYLPFAMERAVTAFDFKPVKKPEPPAPEEGAVEEAGAPKEAGAAMSKVTFAAVRQALIPKFLDLHSGKGLKQTAIQVSSFALYNLHEYLRREGAVPVTSGDTLLIEMGARRTEFILIAADGELLYTRSVEKGGDDLTTYLAAKEGISFEEAEARKVEKWEETCLADPAELLEATQGLCLEVDRTVRYLRNKNLTSGVTQVIVSGGGSARPELCRILSAPSGIETPLVLNGLDVIKSGSRTVYGPAYSAVLGAALAQVDETTFFIDLLPVDVVKLQLLAMRRKMLLKLAMVGVAAVLLGLAALGVAVLVSDAKVDRLVRERDAKRAELANVNDLERRVKELDKAVKNVAGVVSRKTTWTDVLSRISSCLTTNMWITAINVNKDNQLSVEGYSRNTDYLLFEEAMAAQKRFENATIPTSKAMMQYGIQVTFFKFTCDVLPDYKYSEKLRGLLQTEEEPAEPEQKAEPPAEQKRSQPAEQKQEQPAEPAAPEAQPRQAGQLMQAPVQGNPFRLGLPSGRRGVPAGNAQTAAAEAAAAGTGTNAPAAKARPLRLMEKRRADAQAAADKLASEQAEAARIAAEQAEEAEQDAAAEAAQDREAPEAPEAPVLVIRDGEDQGGVSVRVLDSDGQERDVKVININAEGGESEEEPVQGGEEEEQ